MDTEDEQKFCPNCSQLYRINLASSKLGPNLPLFLPCGHSMCENCILNIIKCLEPIECKVCQTEVEFSNNDASVVIKDPSKLHDFFPINKYMVGELAISQLKKSKIPNKKCDYFAELKSALKKEVTQGNCIECNANTNKMCQQCATILCDICFNKSHKNFIVFKTHELQEIVTAMQSKNCQTHKEKPLEYYCGDCKKPICMDCMMVGGGEKSCKNHNVVSINDINEDFFEDLNEISPKVDEVFRRLTKTAVDVGYLLANQENDSGATTDFVKVLANIDQHFSKLFSIVQKHKEEIFKIVKDLKYSEKESLLQANTDVVNSVKKATYILKMIKAYSDPQKRKQANLAALLNDAKEIIDIPWYLNKDDSNKESLKITVNEDLCSLINDYVQLEGNVKSMYKLHSTSQLTEDKIEIPPPPNAPVLPPELPKDVRETTKSSNKEEPKAPALYKNAPKYRSKSGSVSSLNSMDSENSMKSYITQNDNYHQPIVHQVSPFPESQVLQQLREGSQELIYISHIVDPHNFYVQRVCHQGRVKEMLREFRNAVSFTKPSTNHITRGKIYLAFNKADNMWQRCRVVEFDKDNTKNLKVYYFDFGSSETITIDRLRLIPAQRIHNPCPLALKCCLANCMPVSGAWTSDDSILIQNIIDNKQAVIHIRNVTSTSAIDVQLECDVTTFEHGVSLAHALVFHGRAKLRDPRQPYPFLINMKEKPKLYMSHNDFKNEEPEPAYITHVLNPDKFYLRKQHLQAVYEKLASDLHQDYSLASDAGTVYLPEIGMVCVVNVEKYQTGDEEFSWARGVVLELPGRGRVQVLLPDSGQVLLVHWSMLRYIHQKFTSIRAIAIECHLSGVTPLNKVWSAASATYLKKYEGGLLDVQVEDNRNWTNRNRGSIGVVLYDNTDLDNIICINQEMIKHKYAVTFGIFKFNHNSSVEKQVVTNKSPLVEHKRQVTRSKKIRVLKREEKAEVNEEDLQAKDKGPLRLEAKILNYQSPSLIYISLVHQQKTFSELFEKMQKYYSKNKPEPSHTQWKAGDRCSSLCNQSQTWRRAVIMEIENENAKLFYSDFASIETIPLTNLRKLTTEFEAFGNAAIMCHLCGIVPAVGEEWPSLTKEFLKEMIDAYQRIFITKIGNFKGKSMPIEIWVYHTTQGDALEPNKSEWRCLNKKIVDQGLGIPDATQIVAPTTNDGADQDEILSFLNIKGSVNEWLQLDTVPIKMIPVEKEAENREYSPSLTPENEDKDDASISKVMYISDWLPTEPLSSNEFIGLPTYIDNDGVIYLHDIKQQDTLDLIRKALDVRFKGPDPKAKYTKWTVGEPCVALFFLDKKFYRGRIIEVNDENSTCLIQYVDYGNEEYCNFTNIRKSVPLHQIPIQAHKCILSRIRPVGKHWDRPTLDYLHRAIVEKQCTVKVMGEPVNGITPIELQYDKLLINDHMVDFEMAEYCDGTKSVIKKYAPLKEKSQYTDEAYTVVSDTGPDFTVVDDNEEELSQSDNSFEMSSIKGTDWNKIIAEDTSSDNNCATYPKLTEEEFVCNITVINDIHTLELNIVFDENSSKIYEQMYEDLQSGSQSLPQLNGIFENKPCVAIFPEDGLWYRASILQYSEAKNQIKVKYVDYGNIEIISFADAREILEEWTKLPPASTPAKLYGLQVNPDVDVDLVAKEFTNIFLDKGPFLAKIIDYEGLIPVVELQNENKEPIYDKLSKNNVFVTLP